jgi:hypothetical protein
MKKYIYLFMYSGKNEKSKKKKKTLVVGHGILELAVGHELALLRV